jgi:hypothetical protein
MESGCWIGAFFITLAGPLSHGSAALAFVISTEAQRSGEISVLTPLPGNVFRQSAAQWRDLRFLLAFTTTLYYAPAEQPLSDWQRLAY